MISEWPVAQFRDSDLYAAMAAFDVFFLLRTFASRRKRLRPPSDVVGLWRRRFTTTHQRPS